VEAGRCGEAKKSTKSTAQDKPLNSSDSMDEPEWFMTIMKWFRELPFQGSWKDLLDSWAAFEKHEGYGATHELVFMIVKQYNIMNSCNRP
jgi:hypothetical protein